VWRLGTWRAGLWRLGTWRGTDAAPAAPAVPQDYRAIAARVFSGQLPGAAPNVISALIGRRKKRPAP